MKTDLFYKYNQIYLHSDLFKECIKWLKYYVML
jgi:hypothetical protein